MTTKDKTTKLKKEKKKLELHTFFLKNNNIQFVSKQMKTIKSLVTREKNIKKPQQDITNNHQDNYNKRKTEYNCLQLMWRN